MKKPPARLLLLALALTGGLACQGVGGVEGVERAGGREGDGKGGAGIDPPGLGGQGGATDPPDQVHQPDAAAGDDAAEPSHALDGSVEAGPSLIPIEMLRPTAARLTCERVFTCCMPGERTGLAPDRETCEEDVRELLRPFGDALARSVGAGRAAYDGAQLSRCLDALGGSLCAQARGWEVLALTTQCPFVTPKVVAGGACQRSFECIDGYCLGGTGDKDGTCVIPKKPNDQACDSAEDCKSGGCHPTLDVCAAPQPGNLCD